MSIITPCRGFWHKKISQTPNPLAPSPFDNFESYVAGSSVNGMASGWSWTDGWVDGPLFIAISGLDTFQSYSSGSAVNGLSGGTDWSGNWVDKALG